MDIFTLEKQLDRFYTSEKLADINKRYLTEFVKSYPEIFKDWGLVKVEYEGVYVRKKQLVRLLAIILTDRLFLPKFLRLLPAGVKKTMEIIVWEGPQDISKIEKRIDEKIISKNEKISPGKYTTIKTDYCIFQRVRNRTYLRATKAEDRLDLPPLMRQELKTVYSPPAGYDLLPLKSSVKTRFYYKNGGRILEELPVFIKMMQHDTLKFTKTGISQKRSLTELQKRSELEEFYGNTDDKFLKTLRTELLVHMILWSGNAIQDDKPLVVLNKIFQNYQAAHCFPSLSLLSHIKGWSRTSATKQTGIHQSIISLLAQLPFKHWISLDQIKRFALLRDIDFNLVGKDEIERHLYFSTNWQGWGHAKERIGPESYQMTVAVPMLKAYFFLFSSCGLVDIAYDFPKHEIFRGKSRPYLTVFDGLKYVRLTELGSYISGQQERYISEFDQKEQTKVFLDDNRLIIRLSRPDKFIEMILEQMANRIAKARYKVDFSSFIKGCFTRGEIEKRISLFKDKISADWPALWHDFFKRALTKAEAVKHEPEAVVYRVVAAEKEIIQLLSKDTELKNHVIKAENFYLIIKKRDLSKVKARLKCSGYLLQ